MILELEIRQAQLGNQESSLAVKPPRAFWPTECHSSKVTDVTPGIG